MSARYLKLQLQEDMAPNWCPACKCYCGVWRDGELQCCCNEHT
ncbi:MAG: hypothetical protein U0931_35960 [Vulcanimicrobiota bacterium]